MASATRILLLMAACLPLAACATVTDIGSDGSFQPNGRYVLSAHEQKLSCQKLSGSIYVKLEVLKDYDARSKPSLAARAGQTAGHLALGYSAYGSQPVLEHRQQLARTRALNEQLKAKGCKAYDINAELAGSSNQ
jgi:hypothetical protein